MEFLFNKIFKNQNFWIGILFFSLNVCGSFSRESQLTSSKQKTNQNGIPVLIYHEIVIHSAKEPGETVITLEKFEEQMQYLFSQGYNPITMRDLLLYIEKEKFYLINL